MIVDCFILDLAEPNWRLLEEFFFQIFYSKIRSFFGCFWSCPTIFPASHQRLKSYLFIIPFNANTTEWANFRYASTPSIHLLFFYLIHSDGAWSVYDSYGLRLRGYMEAMPRFGSTVRERNALQRNGRRGYKLNCRESMPAGAPWSWNIRSQLREVPRRRGILCV